MNVLSRALRAATYRSPLLIGSILIACSGTVSCSANNSPSQSTGAATESPVAVGSTPSASASPRPASSAEATPSSFTSTVYGYSVVVPAGWSSIAATSGWDGVSGLSHDSPEVDQWISPGGTRAAWASAAAYADDLRSYTKKIIADTVKYHGATCIPPPAAQEPITIGGEAGTLIAWNCGILINLAGTVHNGIGYTFGFFDKRDLAVQAATDPADHEIYIGLLESVDFPD